MKMQVRSFITQNFFDFSYFFCRNRNRMHLLVYIHSSALALAHTLGFLNEKLILGRKITLIFYVPWSVKMRLIHLDPPKISESAFLCQKYPPKANSSSSFFFKTIFFTDILTRIVAVLFSWVKVKREEKIRPKSTFQIKIANVKEIRESSFLRRIVKHSSLVVSSIVVYYGSKGLKNQSPRIIFQTTFFWKMNLQNCSKIVTKLPACCRKKHK